MAKVELPILQRRFPDLMISGGSGQLRTADHANHCPPAIRVPYSRVHIPYKHVRQQRGCCYRRRVAGSQNLRILWPLRLVQPGEKTITYFCRHVVIYDEHP